MGILKEMNKSIELDMEHERRVSAQVDELIDCIVENAVANGGEIDQKQLKAIYSKERESKGILSNSDKEQIKMRIQSLYRQRVREMGANTTTVNTVNAPAQSWESTLKEFSERIMQLGSSTASLTREKKRSVFTWFIIVLLWLMLWPFIIVYKSCTVAFSHFSMVQLKGKDKDKAELIQRFAVPGQASEIKDLALYIQSQIRPLGWVQVLQSSGLYAQRWNRVWMDKLGEIERKASSVHAGDAQFVQEIKTIVSDCNAVIEDNKRKSLMVCGAGIVLFVLLLIIS